MSQKKILLLCDAFPPAFAPRMGYLCKYLPEYGWDSVVVTEEIAEKIFPQLAENRNVTYINYYLSENRFIQKIKYAFVFAADLLFGYKNYVLKKTAQRKIDKQDFSLILVSSYRAFPLKAAVQLSRRNKLPLVMDLRDIVEQFSDNEHISKRFSKNKVVNNIFTTFLTKRLLNQRNKALAYADVVTTVSPFHVETVSQYNQHVTLIYNGFAPELFFPKIKHSEQFKIVYTGKILSTVLEDPNLLFESVAQLSAKEKIIPQLFRIQFYTNEKTKEIVRALADKYKIEKYIDCFDMVNSALVPDILHDSSVLLLLTNKQKTGTKGIMTTKFFEYLAVEKPILCIRNDESYLEKTIHETQSGISAKTVEEVSDFILLQYAEWQKNGYTHQQVNKSEKQQYSRKRQAEEFVSIFGSLLKHTK